MEIVALLYMALFVNADKPLITADKIVPFADKVLANADK